MRLTTKISLLAFMVAPIAAASPVLPPWSRLGDVATYQAWDTFSSITGPNAPNSPGDPIFGPFVDQAPHNANGAGNVVETTGLAFIAGSLNIYSPEVATKIKLTSPDFNKGAAYVTTVLFQVRTLGTEAVYAGPGGIRLTYNDGTDHTLLPFAAKEMHREALGGEFGGDLVDYAVVFHVPTSASLLTFNVDASESSMSFDRASIDTITTRATAGSTLLPGMDTTIGFVPIAGFEVPEPASLGGLAIAGVIFLKRRVRR